MAGATIEAARIRGVRAEASAAVPAARTDRPGDGQLLGTRCKSCGRFASRHDAIIGGIQAVFSSREIEGSSDCERIRNTLLGRSISDEDIHLVRLVAEEHVSRAWGWRAFP